MLHRRLGSQRMMRHGPGPKTQLQALSAEAKQPRPGPRTHLQESE